MAILGPGFPNFATCLRLADDFLGAFRRCDTETGLFALMESLAHEMDCRHFALIHHDDLRSNPANRVNLKHYPAPVTDRIIGKAQFRRDPVMRGCLFADGAFLWSDLPRIITISRHDRWCLEQGQQAGLNEGITVPCIALGQCVGSCTFAGMRHPQEAHRYLGMAQMLGIFAFQAAKRILGFVAEPAPPHRLHPRPRECVVLAGRGYSNKQIARALELTPRTVDGYLREARRLFQARDRAELVVSAILAGEVGLDEVKRGQPA